MSFLSPLVLLALAAAAIPVILHLINLQRPKRISFSSLTFVRSVQQESVQRLRIRRWLLLALRVAIVFCLVLAFAGPTLPGSWVGGAGDRGAMSVGIVLDTSPSMLYGDGSVSRIDGARERLQQLIDQLERRDEVFTATTTDASQMRHGSVATAVERLSVEEPSPGVQPLTRVTSRMASFVDREARHGTRVVVVISDLQRSTLVDSVETPWPDNMQALLMPVESEPDAYPAITDIEIESPFATVGSSIEISVTVESYASSTSGESLNAHLHLGDERVAQRSVDVGSPGIQRLSFSVSPATHGWLPVRVELDHGGPLPNNRRYAVLHVPEEQRVLIVRGAGQQTQFLDAVLGIDIEGGGPLFQVEVVEEDDAPGTDLSDYDAVLLVGLETQLEQMQENIQRYVGNGGGLHVFPGRPGSDDSMNALLQSLEGPSVTDRHGWEGESEIISRVADYNLQHPVLKSIFENGVRVDQIEQPAVYQYVSLEDDSRPGSGIAYLLGGEPLVHEFAFQRGRVLTWAVAPDTEWSDLPETAVFVPLMHRSVQLSAAGVGATGPSVLAGRQAELHVPSTEEDEWHILAGPDGEEYVPLSTNQAGLRSLLFRPAPRRPGIYDLRQRDSFVQRVAVNMAAEESDPYVYSSDEAVRIFADWLQYEPTVISENADASIFGTALAGAGTRTHIWNLFIVMALLCMLAESVVARRWYTGMPLSQSTRTS